jgi:hypothetical protein
MEITDVAQWVVVTKLLRLGYNPTHVRLEYIVQLTNGLMQQFDADELMDEYRRWLQ